MSSRPLDSGPPTVPFLPPALASLCKGEAFESMEPPADVRDRGPSLVRGTDGQGRCWFHREWAGGRGGTGPAPWGQVRGVCCLHTSPATLGPRNCEVR